MIKCKGRLFAGKLGRTDRKVGVMFINRPCDWAYLDVYAWRYYVMVNLWRTR